MEGNIRKVYVVIGATGDYEDFRTHIEGIFEDKKDANSLAKALNEKMEQYRQLPQPYPGKTWDELNDAQYIKYERWQKKVYEADQWRGATVSTYPLQ